MSNPCSQEEVLSRILRVAHLINMPYEATSYRQKSLDLQCQLRSVRCADLCAQNTLARAQVSCALFANACPQGVRQHVQAALISSLASAPAHSSPPLANPAVFGERRTASRWSSEKPGSSALAHAEAEPPPYSSSPPRIDRGRHASSCTRPTSRSRRSI